VTRIGGPSLGRACEPACSGAVRCAWVPAAYASLRRLFSGLPPSSQSQKPRRPAERPATKTKARLVALEHALVFWASARGQLFRELKTVSVGVEHVEQPHLPVQLEDDSHFDAIVP
jgi:hypothetical protein